MHHLHDTGHYFHLNKSISEKKLRSLSKVNRYNNSNLLCYGKKKTNIYIIAIKNSEGT